MFKLCKLQLTENTNLKLKADNMSNRILVTCERYNLICALVYNVMYDQHAATDVGT